MKALRSALASLGVAALLVASPASAAVEEFLHLAGIQGSSTQQHHESDIVVNELVVGTPATRGADAFHPLSGSRAGQKLTSVQIKKAPDRTDTVLAWAARGHRVFSIATVDVVDSRTSGERPVYRVTLADAVIRQITKTSEQGRPLVVLTLTFSKVKIETYSTNAQGTTTSSGSYGWDVTNNRPL